MNFKQLECVKKKIIVDWVVGAGESSKKYTLSGPQSIGYNASTGILPLDLSQFTVESY